MMNQKHSILILCTLALLTALGISLKARAQTTSACSTYSIASEGSSLVTSQGCENEVVYRKLTYTYIDEREPHKSVQISVDSRDFLEERSRVEEAIGKILMDGLSRAQSKYLNNEIIPILKQALNSKDLEIRQGFVATAEIFLNDLLYK